MILVITVGAFTCTGVSAFSQSADQSMVKASEETVSRYAVLVGVTKYPYLSRNVDLIGPKNDALLMRDVLLNKGFEPNKMHLLVDEVDGGKEPTRENIMSSLAEVASQVIPGDYVYMHFAGHGSQAPVAMDKLSEANELDGLDEIFLPKDAKGWDSRIGEVTNAIKDDDVAQVIASIRNKGAFVWAVFDSCHSGTMTRGQVTMRKLSPEMLGIPQDLLDAAGSSITSRGGPTDKRVSESPFTITDLVIVAKNDQTDTEISSRGAPSNQANSEKSQSGMVKKGGYVAFFAAQTTQTTPEMRLPVNGDNKKNHGLFTYYISQVISTVSGNVSYRQAAEQVLQNYNSHSWRQSTPLFEGDLDASLLGQELVDNSVQWKVSIEDGELQIDGGEFHQLAEGSILSIVATPTSNEIIGYVKVTETYSLHSLANVYQEEGQALLDLTKLPDSAYARIEQNQFNVSLTYGYELDKSIDLNEKKALEGVLKKLQSDVSEGLALISAGEGDPADIRLFAIDHKLYFLGDDEDYPCVGEYANRCDDRMKLRKFIKVPLSSDTTTLHKEVRQRMLAIAKANNLRRLASVLGDAKDHLNTSFKHKRKGDVLELPTIGTPQLLAGDKLEVTFQNNHDRDIDVNMFFIDSDYGVTQLYPRNGRSNRMQPKQQLPKPIKLKINADTIGRESILIIATEATRGAAYSDFSFLSQDSLGRSRGASRLRGGISGVKTFLQQSGFGSAEAGVATRGISMDGSESGVSGVQLFSFDTTPN